MFRIPPSALVTQADIASARAFAPRLGIVS